MTDAVFTLLNIIDELKETLPDQRYIELVNLLQQIQQGAPTVATPDRPRIVAREGLPVRVKVAVFSVYEILRLGPTGQHFGLSRIGAAGSVLFSHQHAVVSAVAQAVVSDWWQNALWNEEVPHIEVLLGNVVISKFFLLCPFGEGEEREDGEVEIREWTEAIEAKHDMHLVKVKHHVNGVLSISQFSF